MSWNLVIRHKTRKEILRLPARDTNRIKAVLDEIEADPFSGDIQKIGDEEHVWRRRTGPYRIFYELSGKQRVVFVFWLERRTSKTYKRKK